MESDNQTPAVFARNWLILGVLALAVAGIFSLVLVVARTPALSSIPLFTRIFHEALVVHVDLSVLVWFLCVACMFWSMEARKGQGGVVERGALICMGLGTLLLALSPLDPNAEALMSNYIPVISSPLFFLGLALIGCATGLQLLHFFLSVEVKTIEGFASYTAGLITLLALGAFVLAYQRMPEVIEGQQYFELLFWGGGHVLQFTHGQFLMLTWLLLAWGHAGKLTAPFLIAFSIGLLAALASPLAFFLHDVTSREFRQFFMVMMIAGGGVGPLSVAITVALSARSMKRDACWTALLSSLALFAYGGVLGMMIHGQNVTIPAHYHGSIVGVTLAFCGLAYLLLPRFGYGDVAGTKLAFWQPVVYGIGQFMHISGLAWSGGYGVLRKTPGALEGGFTSAKAAMGLMGGGGFIAIIGGFMFVIVVYRSVRGTR